MNEAEFHQQQLERQQQLDHITSTLRQAAIKTPFDSGIAFVSEPINGTFTIVSVNGNRFTVTITDD
jgi:hypothetical protein